MTTREASLKDVPAIADHALRTLAAAGQPSEVLSLLRPETSRLAQKCVTQVGNLCEVVERDGEIVGALMVDVLDPGIAAAIGYGDVAPIFERLLVWLKANPTTRLSFLLLEAGGQQLLDHIQRRRES